MEGCFLTRLSLSAGLLSAVTRHWPFANGSGRLIDRLGRRINLGAGLRECQVTGGFAMQVLADDHIGRHLILSGQFDRSTMQVLLAFAEAGDHGIDVGANIGYLSCLLLHHRPRSRVLCIEPQPDIAALLRHNLAQFAAGRWSVLEAGLSDAESEGRMHVSAANRGAGALVAQGQEANLTVPLLPAAQVFGELTRLDIMKMDIEGHEETVFRSAAQAITRLQPKAILFEDQLGKAGPAGPIGRQLADCGYRVYGISKQLLATRLVLLDTVTPLAFNDYLALSRSRDLPQHALRRFGVQP
jgi:FkbM family methyltransferase